MKLKIPTYEEYKDATQFAKFRYRFGIYVNIICIVLFVLLLFFIYYYGEELAANPLIYGAKKYNVDCSCHNFETGRNIMFNTTDLIFKQKTNLQINP